MILFFSHVFVENMLYFVAKYILGCIFRDFFLPQSDFCFVAIFFGHCCKPLFMRVCFATVFWRVLWQMAFFCGKMCFLDEIGKKGNPLECWGLPFNKQSTLNNTQKLAIKQKHHSILVILLQYNIALTF